MSSQPLDLIEKYQKESRIRGEAVVYDCDFTLLQLSGAEQRNVARNLKAHRYHLGKFLIVHFLIRC